MALNNGRVCNYSSFSDDHGRSWHKFPRYDIIVHVGDTVVSIDKATQTVTRSYDNGNTWHTLPAPPPYVFTLHSCATISGRDIVTAGDYFYYSADLGDTWHRSVNMDSVNMRGDWGEDIQSKGDTLLAGTDRHGIIISENKGRTWRRMSDGLQNWSPSSLTCSGNRCYLKDLGNIRQAPDGLWWRLVPSSGPLVSGSYIYATDHGLYSRARVLGTSELYQLAHSADNGSTWQKLNRDSVISFPTDFYVKFFFDGQTLYSSSLIGFIASDDYGLTWRPANKGLSRTLINSFSLSPFGLVASSDKDVWTLADTGRVWRYAGSRRSPERVSRVLSFKKTLFAQRGSSNIYYSVDSGSTWVYTQLNPHDQSLFCLGSNLYTGDYKVALSSGLFPVPQGNQQMLPSFLTNCYEAVSRDNIALASPGGGLYRTLDSGTTWTRLTSRRYKSLCLQGDLLYGIDEQSHLSFSSDTGRTFTSVPTIRPLNPNTPFFPFLSRVTKLYVLEDSLFVVSDSGIYKTGDQCRSFQRLIVDPNAGEITCLAKFKGQLFIGTRNRGVWRRGVDPFVFTDKLPVLAGLGSFMSVYPNPGQGAFTVSWKDQHPSAQLEVLNLQGQSLLRTTLHKGGDLKVKVEAPPGMYLFRLAVAGKLYAKRVVVE